MAKARIYDDFDWNLIRVLLGGNTVRIVIQGDRKSGNISVEAVVLDTARITLESARREVDMRVFEEIKGYSSTVMPVIEDVARLAVRRNPSEGEEEEKE